MSFGHQTLAFFNPTDPSVRNMHGTLHCLGNAQASRLIRLMSHTSRSLFRSPVIRCKASQIVRLEHVTHVDIMKESASEI